MHEKTRKEKNDLWEQLTSPELNQTSARRVARRSLSVDQLRRLLDEAIAEAARTKEQEQELQRREQQWVEVFGEVKSPSDSLIADAPDTLVNATAQLRDMVYLYGELASSSYQYRQVATMLIDAWQAYREGAVFPNGLSVSEDDIDRLVADLRIWTRTSLNVVRKV